MAGADKVLFVLMMMMEERFEWKRVDAVVFLKSMVRGSLRCEWSGGRQKPWLRYGEIYISGK